jgi:riboflavin biosynthesis pyrimidine reductase
MQAISYRRVVAGVVIGFVVAIAVNAARAADPAYTVTIPEGTVDADVLLLYPTEKPIRVVADRFGFADSFESPAP